MLTHDDLKAVPYTSETTTVIGDMSQLDCYIKSGRALRDWNNAIAELEKRFEKEVAESSHLWDHIIIPDRNIYRRESSIMERIQEIFHS